MSTDSGARSEDFGPGRCECRRWKDDNHYICVSKRRLVTGIERDRTISCKDCRLCERLGKQLEEKKKQSLEERERIKTEGKKARKAIHGENRGSPQVDYANCAPYGTPDLREYERD